MEILVAVCLVLITVAVIFGREAAGCLLFGTLAAVIAIIVFGLLVMAC
jgi:hypothetical protein